MLMSVATCLNVCLPACLPACLSVHLPACLSVVVCVCLSLCLSVRPRVCHCMSACLLVFLPPCHLHLILDNLHMDTVWLPAQGVTVMPVSVFGINLNLTHSLAIQQPHVTKFTILK